MSEVRLSCPLGAQCEEIKDNVLTRCCWHTHLVGKDPQSNKDIDEWRCAMSWLPIMLTEVAQASRGTTQSVVSLRDESVSRQDIFNAIMVDSIKKASNTKMLLEGK